MVAEIGINHNGYIQDAIDMIHTAHAVGFDYVKFQKRNPELAIPKAQWDKPKKVPWRKKETTYLQYKKDIEFSREDYDNIDNLCKKLGIKWFASVWDLDSVNFMTQYDLPLIKVPSAKLTDHKLIQACTDNFGDVMVSTGMSTQDEIDEMVLQFHPKILMHTNANYPTPFEEINLGYLDAMMETNVREYFYEELGYSNHCPDEAALYMAAIYNIQWMEVHVTMNKYYWGSDQASSFKLKNMDKIIERIRLIHEGKQFDGWENRKLYPGEEIKREILRGI
jgi:N-acetylneuraminate synthase